MAKKKKILPPPPVLTNTYYAYYDKDTKQLLALTNEKINIYNDYLEVDFDTYESLVSGRQKFSDYLLGLVTSGETTSLKLLPVIEHAYNFKNTMLDIVVPSSVKKPELTVEWNNANKEWNFFISPLAKSRLITRINAKILFFIILESDYDFLIRSISIDTTKLFSQVCVGVKFESKLEEQIDKISVATGVGFESSNLRIVNE